LLCQIYYYICIRDNYLEKRQYDNRVTIRDEINIMKKYILMLENKIKSFRHLKDEFKVELRQAKRHTKLLTEQLIK
jgi:hypothetical protein